MRIRARLTQCARGVPTAFAAQPCRGGFAPNFDHAAAFESRLIKWGVGIAASAFAAAAALAAVMYRLAASSP